MKRSVRYFCWKLGVVVDGKLEGFRQCEMGKTYVVVNTLGSEEWVQFKDMKEPSPDEMRSLYYEQKKGKS